jgi:hypothetical protein
MREENQRLNQQLKEKQRLEEQRQREEVERLRILQRLDEKSAAALRSTVEVDGKITKLDNLIRNTSSPFGFLFGSRR